MKCKSCGHETTEPSKTIVINGIEYETETHDKGKKLSDIQIPKGWRLWKASDFEKFSLTDWDKLNLKDDWFFIQYPFSFNPNDYFARFGAYSDGANLGCDGNPSNSYSDLGVRFCKDKKVTA